MNTLDKAIEWANRGFRVFPLIYGDKKPAIKSWPERATTDIDQIKAMWGDQEYNIGCATGDGLLVVDIDPQSGGSVSEFFIDLPDTFTVATPSGGKHLYFKGPDVRLSASGLVHEEHGKLVGIDIRSARGYVVAPGSYFSDPDGIKGYTGYYTLAEDRKLTEAPEHLVLMAGRASQMVVPSFTPDELDRQEDIEAARDYLEVYAPVAIEGEGGSDTTYRVCCKLHDLGLSVDVALSLLNEDWNDRCSPPWQEDELYAICESAYKYARNPVGCSSLAAVEDAFSCTNAIEEPINVDEPDETDDSVPVLSDLPEDPFTPCKLPDKELLKPRPWVVYGFALRGVVTLLAGPGGTGKSAFALLLAIQGAHGGKFAGLDIPKPFRTVVYNKEDDKLEMVKRSYAVCEENNLSPSLVENSVALVSGDTLNMLVYSKKPIEKQLESYVESLKRNRIDMLVMDPFASLHEEEENDNTAMGHVMSNLVYIAREANVSVVIVHHTPKGNNNAGSADAIRGAGNIVNSARLAFTYYPVREEDAKKYNIPENEYFSYVRMDVAKSNMSPFSKKPIFFKKKSVEIGVNVGDTSVALVHVDSRILEKSGKMQIANVLRDYVKSKPGIDRISVNDAIAVVIKDIPMFKECLSRKDRDNIMNLLKDAFLDQSYMFPDKDEMKMVKHDKSFEIELVENSKD